ncbi:hypothetical protein FB567DRAFT_189854 [Paraphoma chrysanthemicola]|uniref:Uncharacterized protein n=1 Tax=Paraphoma chrysanthemicola TaxID=798071 RepID=A0A8K0QX52_9PLEO|nr:hypothetical protein FB567DRAFT_189854 [Paraphoma chrysanthemicola]
MANSTSLTKKEAAQQQLQQQSQHAHDVETQEHHAKASASAGLNLNIFGALSGAFSSKSKKTTRQNVDGSSEIVEDRHDQVYDSRIWWCCDVQGVGEGMANAAARGQGTAYAQGSAEEHRLKAKERGVGQEAVQGKKVTGKVDHLGIES